MQTPFRWAGWVFLVLIAIAMLNAVRRRETERWLACAMPIVLAIFASCIGQYPFDGGRLTLFLMPSLFLLVGAGSAFAWEAIPPVWRPIWWRSRWR